MSTKSAVTALEITSMTCTVLCTIALIWAVITAVYGESLACFLSLIAAAATAITYKVTELKALELRRQYRQPLP